MIRCNRRCNRLLRSAWGRWGVAVVAAWGLLAAAADTGQAQIVTVYRPLAVYYPAPVVVARPIVAAPLPAPTVVAYPPPPAVVYQPMAQVRTRYRPFLGGTVSRVRYGYVPVIVP